jgi:TRAP-type transport system periplasmic protein
MRPQWMLAAAAALGVVLGLLTAESAVASTQWHMPTPYPDGDHHTRNVRAFAADVREATGGELEIIVHSAGALIKHPEIHRAVRGNQVAIGELLMSSLGNDDPLFNLDNLPFLATDFPAARRLWQVSRPAVEATLERQGLQLLYAVPWPPQGLFTRRPIESVGDLRQLKLRTYSPLTSRLAALLGAALVSLQAPELPQAFSTGIVEAMFTSPTTAVSSQAWDFVDHYLDTRAWIPKNMVVVNQRALRRLSPEQQQALLAAAAAAEERGWQLAEIETSEKTAELAARGMTVMQPGARLEGELRAIGETMMIEWRAAAGEPGERILEAFETAR